jgi:hypothetical protein
MSAIRYDGVKTWGDKRLANIAKTFTKTLPPPLLRILGSFLFQTRVLWKVQYHSDKAWVKLFDCLSEAFRFVLRPVRTYRATAYRTRN